MKNIKNKNEIFVIVSKYIFTVKVGLHLKVIEQSAVEMGTNALIVPSTDCPLDQTLMRDPC